MVDTSRDRQSKGILTLSCAVELKYQVSWRSGTSIRDVNICPSATFIGENHIPNRLPYYNWTSMFQVNCPHYRWITRRIILIPRQCSHGRSYPRLLSIWGKILEMGTRLGYPQHSLGARDGPRPSNEFQVVLHIYEPRPGSTLTETRGNLIL